MIRRKLFKNVAAHKLNCLLLEGQNVQNCSELSGLSRNVHHFPTIGQYGHFQEMSVRVDNADIF
jgi:hypothetical protein